MVVLLGILHEDDKALMAPIKSFISSTDIRLVASSFVCLRVWEQESLFDTVVSRLYP